MMRTDVTETMTTPSAGLVPREEGRTPVPLRGVSIEAEISGFCARVSVAQRYVNTEDKPIEAVYVFPLDEGAAVCGFEAVLDGTLVVGEVQEREKAFEIYDEAIQDGHGAFLLDEERPDVFQASVGNLLPGKEALVRLTYVTELSFEGGRVRFSVPTTVSPRYAPDADRSGVGRPDAETLNPPVAWRVPYGLNLSVRVSTPDPIRAVESPSHPISIEFSEREASITLSQTQVALERDFVLCIDAAGLDAPQAWIEQDESGEGAVAIGFAPAFEVTSVPAEIVFVVDRSGSMDGSSIEEVRNALQLCLRSMTPGCRFNIVGFGSTYQSLFRESRPYDQASLDAASQCVAALRADLGGTEILPALTFALERPRDPGLSRQIVVLTDGEVTNTDAVLALAARHAGDARIFTFGIGAGASQHLVRGLARAGNGAAEFIYPGERIEPKVVRQFGRLLSPALDAVRVEWVGGKVTQAPDKVPPVFAGSRLLVYGFVRGDWPSAARLSATGPAGPIVFEVPLDSARMRTGNVVATLAARARIRELEESGGWLNTRGSRQTSKRESSVSSEIKELSIRYQLVSRETSFVAVERREMPVTGDMQLRRVPIALTSGWGGLDRGSTPIQLGFSAMRMSAAMLSEPRSVREPDLETPSYVPASYLLADAPAAPASRPARGQRTPATSRPAGLDTLVALQAADGSWELTSELAAILGRSVAELEAVVTGAAGAPPSVRRAWATALAIAWLRRNADSWVDEWRLLANKAERWLDAVAAVPPDRFTWVHAARQFLS